MGRVELDYADWGERWRGPKPVTVTLADGTQERFSATEYRTGRDGSLAVLNGTAELARYPGGSWEKASIKYPPLGGS